MAWGMFDSSQTSTNVVVISPFLPVDGNNNLMTDTPLSRSAEIRH